MLSINFIDIFFCFLLAGVILRHIKKMEHEVANQSLHCMARKKASNRSCSKLNFVQKSPRTRMIDMVVILHGTEIANYIHLGLNAAKNTHYFFKKNIK